MKNPRITSTELALLKGAINGVFSRSELRKAAIDVGAVSHHDPKRPRVKKWNICPSCKEFTPRYLLDVDHIEPRVPVNTNFNEMSVDVYIDRTWCEIKLLQAICKPCHLKKCRVESKERQANKKKRKLK